MSELPTATHYRWIDLPEDRPMEDLVRRRIMGEKVMVAQVRLEEGCLVPTHAHDSEQFALVMSGRMKFGIGADGSATRREVVLTAGEVLLLPSNVPHSAEALEDSLVLDIFSPAVEKTGIDHAETPIDSQA